MCSQCKSSNCKFSVCAGNRCSVYSILCLEVCRQSLVKGNCCRWVCIHNICHCCLDSCSCLHLYIQNIKSDHAFICVISNAVNCFSHDWFIMRRRNRASVNFCCISCTPGKHTSTPDILQMTQAIVGSVCSIYGYTINLICSRIDQWWKSLIIQIQLIVPVSCLCF